MLGFETGLRAVGADVVDGEGRGEEGGESDAVAEDLAAAFEGAAVDEFGRHELVELSGGCVCCEIARIVNGVSVSGRWSSKGSWGKRDGEVEKAHVRCVTAQMMSRCAQVFFHLHLVCFR